MIHPTHHAGMLSSARGILLRIAAAFGTTYLLTLLLAPLVDPSLDLGRSYPEDYAFGPAGWLVRLGYVSGATAWLAIATSALSGNARARIGGVALAAGAAASLDLAVDPHQVTGGMVLAGVIVGLVIGPLVLTSSLAPGTPFRRPVTALAIATLVGFLALVVSPRDAAGIVNRAWDVVLATWTIALALAALMRRRSGAIAGT